jgi:mannose-6-phosphate isomerase-like protein (cupin superfamily)
MTTTAEQRNERGSGIAPETLALIEKAETGIETFAYERPNTELPPGRKLRVKLAQTDSNRAQVQILKEDGENNLHYHANVDLIYMVLQGKVRFYGVGDKLLGEFGPLQGVKLPQYARYWFTSVGDEEALLLQMAGYPKGATEKARVACEPRAMGRRWHERRSRQDT